MEMNNVKTIITLPPAGALSDDDCLPAFQPNVFNPITQQNGRTGKIKINQLREKMGYVGDLHMSFKELSPFELARRRWLPVKYQVLEIAQYQEYCDFFYCGDADNGTANFFYKMNADGTRNIHGLYMRNIDPSGLFFRIAGQSPIFTAAGGTPYDGFEVGNFKSFGVAGSPDYANISSNSKVPSVGGTWVANSDGYVSIRVTGEAVGLGVQSAMVQINGQYLGSIMTYGNQPYMGQLPVKKGDNIHVYHYGGSPTITVRFIPPLGSNGSIAVTVYISY